MIDKSLVKNRFQKSLKTYDDNAIIQKQTAKKLVKMLPAKEYNSIFEIGCATGILTNEIEKSIVFNHFCGNDLIEDSKKFITSIIKNADFIAGDIEEIDLTEKYDLIISNACLQWCNNIEKTIEKLMQSLNKEGILAISIFGDDNLKEITSIFSIKNKTYSMQDLKTALKKYNIIHIEENTAILEFNTPIEVLKHLKLTGTNAVQQKSLTKSKLKDFEEQYSKQFIQNGKTVLTFNPVYIIIKNY